MPAPLRSAALLCALASTAAAQWNPNAGSWLASDATDVRLMTYNVKDGIASTMVKTEVGGQWEALARITAALQPDLLLLQEAGDKTGSGGSGVDSVSVLTNVCRLFLRGGSDPYRGGNVTAYVQKYAPGFDLPYIFVSSDSDGFNRNVLLSSYPFADLNGDTRSTLSDIPSVQPHLYQSGGDGGIRGFLFAELDLDDRIYVGDLVVGGAHLKAGSGSSNESQRRRAAQNVAYVVDHWYQGAASGLGPDPFNKINDFPPATRVLDADTPVVLGGDWNEDEARNGQRGPADWLTQAAQAGGTDGTDRDRSDMLLDTARHVFTGSTATLSGSKLDYFSWQDSLVTVRRQFVFDTAGTPTAALPATLQGFSQPGSASGIASDHRAVVLDLRLPLVDCQEDLGYRGPGTATLSICGGPLVSGNTATLQILGAPRLNPAWLALGSAVNPTPFLGGTLVPWPPAAVLPISINIAGSFVLPVQGGGGPLTLVAQAVYLDPAQAGGLGFTNAVRAVWLP